MNRFNEKEFEELCKKFNVKPWVKEIVIDYPTNSYFNKLKHAVETDRRGEVVFAVIRPNGKVIAVTCEEYPAGIFRIPTGGINYHEDIKAAVFREVKEELGIDSEVVSFAGVLKINFQYKGQSVLFYSYIFIMKETGGRLLLDASDDEVSEVREVDLEGLKEIVESLQDIPGKWHDWGKFRYETNKAVLDYLSENNF